MRAIILPGALRRASNRGNQEEGMRNRIHKERPARWFVAVLIVLGCLSFITAMAVAAETGKFQVVPGSDDKAYLVDTTTGAVWVLTYRTMATGREPIAIPYKFIRSTPKNQGEFLFESIGPNATMPYGGSQ
jgi:hypothetical protein